MMEVVYLFSYLDKSFLTRLEYRLDYYLPNNVNSKLWLIHDVGFMMIMFGMHFIDWLRLISESPC